MAQPGPPNVSEALGTPEQEAKAEAEATGFSPGQYGGSAVFVSRLGLRLLKTWGDDRHVCCLHVAAHVTAVWQRCLVWYYDALRATRFKDVLMFQGYKQPRVKVTLRHRDAVLIALRTTDAVPVARRAHMRRYVDAVEPLVRAWHARIVAAAVAAAIKKGPSAHDALVQSDLCLGVLRLLGLGLTEMRRLAATDDGDDVPAPPALTAERHRLDEEWLATATSPMAAAASCSGIALPPPVVDRVIDPVERDAVIEVTGVVLRAFPTPATHATVVLHVLLRHWMTTAMLRLVAGGLPLQDPADRQAAIAVDVTEIVTGFLLDLDAAAGEDSRAFTLRIALSTGTHAAAPCAFISASEHAASISDHLLDDYARAAWSDVAHAFKCVNSAMVSYALSH